MAARTSDPVATNRRAWDRTLRNHRRFRGDEAACLRRGEDPADLTALGGEALRLLGDLGGKDVLHALCNHGDTTVALAHRCRTIVGVDLSPEAVREARALAAATGSAARFEVAEVCAYVRRTRRRFDVVTALWGVTCWIPDLAAFARGVRRVLRPGGRLVLLDGHPVINTELGVGHPGEGYLASPDGAPRRERWTIDYAAPGRGVAVDIAWWQWTIGDVVTACARAGLAVEELCEHGACMPGYWGGQVAMETDATSSWLRGRRGILPHAFGLTARRT